jgi:5-formyltetrahydrofolate cyclo-ligase
LEKESLLAEEEKTQKRRFRILSNSRSKEPALNLSAFGEKDFDVFRKKSSIRRDLLLRRLSLSPEEVDKSSKEITKNLLRLRRFRNAQRIVLYFPIKNEVETEGIFRKAQELHKEIYFPCIEDSLLEFRKVSDLNELEPGSFGILEPSRDSARVNIMEIDLVIIPGIAFDRFGRRLGYGGGYYDRVLFKIDKKRRIGLAYNFQVLDSIPIEVGDEEVGLVITESGVIIPKRRVRW